MSDLFRLTETQIALLEPCFTEPHGRPNGGDRPAMSGIIFLDRNGSRRRDAPGAHGPHETLFGIHQDWRRAARRCGR